MPGVKQGVKLFSKDEIKAFLLGTRAAWLLASKSRNATVSEYGKTQLQEFDKRYFWRLAEFEAMLGYQNEVDCGVSAPGKVKK